MKVLRMNTTNEVPVIIEGHQVEDAHEFIYLGRIVNNLGGADKDILMVKNIRASRELWMRTTIFFGL